VANETLSSRELLLGQAQVRAQPLNARGGVRGSPPTPES
jgi:hypothetical protein